MVNRRNLSIIVSIVSNKTILPLWRCSLALWTFNPIHIHRFYTHRKWLQRLHMSVATTQILGSIWGPQHEGNSPVTFEHAVELPVIWDDMTLINVTSHPNICVSCISLQWRHNERDCLRVSHNQVYHKSHCHVIGPFLSINTKYDLIFHWNLIIIHQGI